MNKQGDVEDEELIEGVTSVIYAGEYSCCLCQYNLFTDFPPAGSDTVCCVSFIRFCYTKHYYQTVSSNLTFVLAMVLYPEAQRRGQEEVDRVLGKGNLPTFDDLDNLPYLEAIYKEVLRFVVF